MNMKCFKFMLLPILVLFIGNNVFGIGRVHSPKPATAISSDAVSSPKTTNIPGMVGVYTATGTSTILKGLLGSASDTVNILFQFPNGTPSPGDTFVMGTPLTNQTFPNGQTGTVIPMLFQPGGSGGSVSITENSTEPDFSLMNTGDSIICTSNGDWYYKGNGRRYIFNGSVTVDPDTTAPIITITAPATNGTWVNSTTYTGLQGTATDAIGVLMVGWCLDNVNWVIDGVTGTTNWSITPITLAEGSNTIYVVAASAANQGYDSVTINVDTVAPVVAAGADQTHDGTSQTITVSGISVTEDNEIARERQIYNTTTSAVTSAWSTFTGTSFTYTLPANTNDYRFDVRITDPVRSVTDSLNVGYSAATSSFLGFKELANFNYPYELVANEVAGTLSTATASGQLTHIHTYIDYATSTSHFNVAIYNSTGTSKLGEGTLTIGTAIVQPGITDFQLKTPVSVTAGVQYLLVVGSSDDTQWRVVRKNEQPGYTAYQPLSATVGDTMPSAITLSGPRMDNAVLIWADNLGDH